MDETQEKLKKLKQNLGKDKIEAITKMFMPDGDSEIQEMLAMPKGRNKERRYSFKARFNLRLLPKRKIMIGMLRPHGYTESIVKLKNASLTFDEGEARYVVPPDFGVYMPKLRIKYFLFIEGVPLPINLPMLDPEMLRQRYREGFKSMAEENADPLPLPEEALDARSLRSVLVNEHTRAIVSGAGVPALLQQIKMIGIACLLGAGGSLFYLILRFGIGG